MAVGRSGAALWLLAFIGFGLLHAAWALAAPYNGPPDEQQHALRAAAVVRGQVISDLDRVQTVPASLSRGWCFPTKVEVSADCEAEPGGDESPVEAWVTAARYNPVYYVVTGWPLGPWPDWSGLLLARLLTGAMMAALLASAVVTAARWTKHRALVAGVVVAATPMLAHLGGSINPNGLEIAGALALFVALIVLLHEERGRVNRAAVALAGVSATVLVTPRFTGVLWLAVIVGVLLVPASRVRLAELARSRAVRWWSIVVAIATIASIGWSVLVRPADAVAWDRGYSVEDIVRTALLDVWPNIANQMVGVMGWAETLMPRLVYVAWFMAVGLLLLGAVVLGQRVDRWRLLALFVATFTPLLTIELLQANQLNWFTQGRYFLPGAVGLVLLGAYVLAHRGLTAEHLRSTTRLLAVLLVPLQLACLAFTMARWQSGLRTLDPFTGSWLPPFGPVLPLALGATAVVVLLVTYWLASRIPRQPPIVPGSESSRRAGRPRPFPRRRQRRLPVPAVPAQLRDGGMTEVGERGGNAWP